MFQKKVLSKINEGFEISGSTENESYDSKELSLSETDKQNKVL